LDIDVVITGDVHRLIFVVRMAFYEPRLLTYYWIQLRQELLKNSQGVIMSVSEGEYGGFHFLLPFGIHMV
jgi:hypothetical protein